MQLVAGLSRTCVVVVEHGDRLVTENPYSRLRDIQKWLLLSYGRWLLGPAYRRLFLDVSPKRLLLLPDGE